ncbi:MAG: uroporphyrinogen decarboxylase [Clostridiales Family XIII bacterium]|nr:uroporphyrinogen decarboxylase [Clostridiales Family XIII bacterium]
MNSNNSIFEERKKTRDDLVSLKKPKRVPVFSIFTLEAACGLAEVSVMEAHYDLSVAEKAYDRICETFYSDSLPVLNLRYPPVYDALGSRNWVLGSNGSMQHSEVELMHTDEYDEFIAGPMKMIMEVFLPRACSELDKDSARAGIALAKAFAEYKSQVRNHAEIYGRLAEKHSYADGIITGPLTVAPFDFIADQLRGIKGIMGDIYRAPEKLLEAVNAVTPHMLKLAVPRGVAERIQCFIPLHLAPLINPAQFDRLYWPSLKRLVESADALGVGSTIFLEQDCTRYIESFDSLPDSMIAWIDDGDRESFAAGLGRNHVFGGFFDPTITLARSKEECIDEAKRLLDTCMDSGHFFFSFNRNVMDIKSIDIAKLAAVLEWVRNNAYY